MARLYAAARLLVNFFQPSFKLKEKRREGAKIIKRYHPPATPYERALGHPKLPSAVKRRLRQTYRTLDPIQLLATIRTAQEELGERVLRPLHWVAFGGFSCSVMCTTRLIVSGGSGLTREGRVASFKIPSIPLAA
jgi:hypothetical protein